MLTENTNKVFISVKINIKDKILKKKKNIEILGNIEKIKVDAKGAPS